jgi:two-component system alkaline phosphatase synthesis response regulator PhoP
MELRASILVVDDQPVLLENIRLALEAEGYQVWTAEDGVEALDILREEQVDLIMADIAMPRMNGYQLYEQVREDPHWVMIPFIFLTARALDSDIRYGKEMGVDDYLTKPIQPEDLLAAVSGRLRRAEQLAQSSFLPLAPLAAEPGSLTLAQLRIDPHQYRAWLNGRLLRLSVREFRLLEYLAQRIGEVVSQQELVRVTHKVGVDYGEAGALLRPLIRSLRHKLGGSSGGTVRIENIRGVGYRLVPLEAQRKDGKGAGLAYT